MLNQIKYVNLMKKLFFIFALVFLFASCEKSNEPTYGDLCVINRGDIEFTCLVYNEDGDIIESGVAGPYSTIFIELLEGKYRVDMRKWTWHQRTNVTIRGGQTTTIEARYD
jgi:hypothetical protein